MTDWLSDPMRFARDAARSGDSELVAYAVRHFPQENKASVSALVSRLDAFTFWRDTKLVLNAPDTFSFPEVLDAQRAIVNVDLGSPPAGAERVQGFWAGFLFRELARAILTRRVTPGSRPRSGHWKGISSRARRRAGRDHESPDLVESIQEMRDLAVESIRCAGAARVAGAPAILHTNAGIEAWFRSPIEDARALGHTLPATDPRDPAAGRAELIERITRMPRRHALLWIKTHRAVFMRSPRIDFDAIRTRAGAAPPDVHTAIRDGIVTGRREALEAHYAKSTLAQIEPESSPVRPEPSVDDASFQGLG